MQSEGKCVDAIADNLRAGSKLAFCSFGRCAITLVVSQRKLPRLGLLDKHDPSKPLARLSTPLIWPDPCDADGYVLNVLYSCRAMVLRRTLLLHYTIANSITTLASRPLDRLLAAIE